ncbi:hypothetical protein PU634_12635 [Oceanimonas pelagia]|uniref:Uncharacterized protein n=1 Tax=Oceanimonas pelagia TaxID=3028314 RepID=A0AA50Q9B9_9GAMM|nr:hypothetical protein [Oceanimonas pelagia]WMC09938.1 hypothetical protein PU634_12635 [Oceanimonas pelagia]
MKTSMLILTLALCGLAQAAPTDEQKQALLADALKAAPPTLRDSVTVVDWEQNVLQQGHGDYTCFPTPPRLNGTAPMCMDGPWREWAQAWMEKKTFQARAMGISYMLAGDGGASNTDPYADGPTDDNQWIVEGPHLMILVPDNSLLDTLPTDPGQGGPYVMWKGTPYAHIMIPVGARN